MSDVLCGLIFVNYFLFLTIKTIDTDKSGVR